MVGFNKKTIKGVSLKDKVVLLRADYNVPVEANKVKEAYRIEASLPTIKYLLGADVKQVVIISHLGRPNGQPDPQFSLRPVASTLEHLLGRHVEFVGNYDSGHKLTTTAKIVLLENLRFNPGEEANDTNFAQQLIDISGADLFVQEGFGVVHRKHASTDAITKLLPSVGGLLLEKEVATISKVIAEPERPLVAVLGGAKVSDKIELIEKFIDMADTVVLAGAMANTFLLAERKSIGKSQAEPELLSKARSILKKVSRAEQTRNFRFILPSDFVVSTSLHGDKSTRVVDMAATLADIQAYPKQPPASSYIVGQNEMILDIGPLSAARVAGIISTSRSVIWNGTAGITEVEGLAGAAAPFSHGTRTIVEAMIGSSRKSPNRPFSLAGGGDTASYLEQNNLVDDFNFVSTGGGAALELMAGHTLPGVEALQDKH